MATATRLDSMLPGAMTANTNCTHPLKTDRAYMCLLQVCGHAMRMTVTSGCAPASAMNPGMHLPL